VGLAQADAGMDVEWIEHHRIAATRGRDLLGGRVRERVGVADRKRLESQARIERRAAERLVRACHRRRDSARCVLGDLAKLTRGLRGLVRFRFGLRAAQHRRSHQQLDAADGKLLGLPAREHTFDIVGLNPALEKTGRDGKPDGILVDSFQVHPGEPARKDVVTDLRA
jgi:hypothetical protein